MNLYKNILIFIIIILVLGKFAGGCKFLPSKEAVVAVTTDSTVTADSIITVVAPVADTNITPAPLTLIINNLTSATAPVIVGVYTAQNKFLSPKDKWRSYSFRPDSKILTAKIKDLKFGVYAIAIYQDVNSNGKIDKNILGIPTEPYAFSNNYKPTVKAPNFKNCKFDYDSAANVITMNMIK
jgi:uncharacterized protein (DUF2141 family)